MASYKVPQDVEAEDKLIGPFGFRQFIYLIVAGVCGFVAYLLFNVFAPLVLIPIPLIGFMLLLALPLKKDQPMETYLLAIARFFFTPRVRIWNPSGTMSYVEISVPKTDDIQLTKGYSGQVASEKLESLSKLMDTRGWSAKGLTGFEESAVNDNLSSAFTAEAAGAVDVMDEGAQVSKSFDEMLARKNEQTLNAARESMQKAALEPKKRESTTPEIFKSQFTSDKTHVPDYNPYPHDMHQKIIYPSGTKPPEVAKKESSSDKSASKMTEPISPAIMNLATNPQFQNMTVSGIAKEAARITRNEMEVVIEHKKR